MKPGGHFVAANVLLAVVAAALILAALVQAKDGLGRPHHIARPPKAACTTVGCANLGDHVTYTLSGTVTQVSSPQPGVVCVQVQAKTHAGDMCALAA